MTATDNKKATKNKLNAKILVEPAPDIPAFFLKKAKNELNAESLIEAPMVTSEFGGSWRPQPLLIQIKTAVICQNGFSRTYNCNTMLGTSLWRLEKRPSELLQADPVEMAKFDRGQEGDGQDSHKTRQKS
jgi:hypothetical protein